MDITTTAYELWDEKGNLLGVLIDYGLNQNLEEVRKALKVADIGEAEARFDSKTGTLEVYSV